MSCASRGPLSPELRRLLRADRSLVARCCCSRLKRVIVVFVTLNSSLSEMNGNYTVKLVDYLVATGWRGDNRVRGAKQGTAISSTMSAVYFDSERIFLPGICFDAGGVPRVAQS